MKTTILIYTLLPLIAKAKFLQKVMLRCIISGSKEGLTSRIEKTKFDYEFHL